MDSCGKLSHFGINCSPFNEFRKNFSFFFYLLSSKSSSWLNGNCTFHFKILCFFFVRSFACQCFACLRFHYQDTQGGGMRGSLIKLLRFNGFLSDFVLFDEGLRTFYLCAHCSFDCEEIMLNMEKLRCLFVSRQQKQQRKPEADYVLKTKKNGISRHSQTQFHEKKLFIDFLSWLERWYWKKMRTWVGGKVKEESLLLLSCHLESQKRLNFIVSSIASNFLSCAIDCNPSDMTPLVLWFGHCNSNMKSHLNWMSKFFIITLRTGWKMGNEIVKPDQFHWRDCCRVKHFVNKFAKKSISTPRFLVSISNFGPIARTFPQRVQPTLSHQLLCESSIRFLSLKFLWTAICSCEWNLISVWMPTEFFLLFTWPRLEIL